VIDEYQAVLQIFATEMLNEVGVDLNLILFNYFHLYKVFTRSNKRRANVQH